MIFEMTRDYSIIVPLMIANLISFFISYRLQREPIYEALAHQEGVHLPGNEARQLSTRRQVRDVVREDEALPMNAALADLADKFKDAANAWPVIQDDKLRGLVTRAQIGAAGSALR